MEELSFQIEKIAGQAREDIECAVINKKIVLANGEVGNLVCCLLVRSLGDSKPSEIVRDIFEVVEGKLEGTYELPLDSLKDILASSRRYLDGQQIEASFLIGFFLENACYVARHGEEVKLLVFEDLKKAEINFEVGSGPVHVGQTYLVATKKFLPLFDEGAFEREDNDLSEIIDGLATDISAHEDQAEIGAIFVRSKKNELANQGDGEIVEGDVEEGGMEVERDIEEADNAPVEQESEIVDKDSQSEKETSEPNFVGAVGAKIGNFFGDIGRVRTGDIGAILRLRRNILILVVLTVVILGGFVGYNLWQRNKASLEEELGKHLSIAQSKLKEGSAIIELNKTRARQILVEAQNEAKQAQTINSRDSEVIKLLEAINGKLKETEVASGINFSTFAQLESAVMSLSYSGSKIVATGTSYVYDVDSNGEIIGKHEGVDGIIGGVSFDNKAFILTGNGALRLDLSNDRLDKITNLSGAHDIGVFFGNVYLLGDNQIIKVIPIEGGWAEPREYLDKKESFGSNSRMAIDSLIWVSQEDSKILKFNRGVREDFEIRGLPEGVGEFGLIFTDSTLGNLYVVDRKNSALLVIDKDGNYKKALTAEEFSKAEDILVNSSEDKIYIAVGEKILTTSIK